MSEGFIPLGSNPSANVAIRAVSFTIEINSHQHTEDIIKARKFYFNYQRIDLKNSALTEKSFQYI